MPPTPNVVGSDGLADLADVTVAFPLRTQPTVIMILVDEHAATSRRPPASAATQPRLAGGPVIKILIIHRPSPCEQFVQFPGTKAVVAVAEHLSRNELARRLPRGLDV